MGRPVRVALEARQTWEMLPSLFTLNVIVAGLPTPAFSYNFETVDRGNVGSGFSVEIRIRPNINVGLKGGKG